MDGGVKMTVLVDRVDSDCVEQPDFELEVLSDAALMAAVYWKNHLWNKEHEVYGPSPRLYVRFGERYGVGGIEEMWRGWFATLTSDDYFVVLAGVDMESIGEEYGRSARRA
jgi:hypothetical protein